MSYLVEATSYEVYKLLSFIQEARSKGISLREISEIVDVPYPDVLNLNYKYVKLLEPSDDNELLLNIAIVCQEMPSRCMTSIYLACRRNGINTLSDLRVLKPKEVRRLKGIGPNYRPILLDLHRSVCFTE